MGKDNLDLRVGGHAGAGIAFLIAYLTGVTILLSEYFTSRWTHLPLFEVFFSPLCLACTASMLGYLSGRLAGRCKSVNRAFVWGGGAFVLLFAGVFLLVFCLSELSLKVGRDYFIYIKMIVAFAPILGSFAAWGSLLCGLSAIVVRDFRQTKRMRLVPQFTLQELLIAVTLSIVLMSCVASVSPLMHWAIP
jgi:hypothetical protein